MRILLVCERLAGKADEGIKNLALSLLGELSRAHSVLALTEGQDSDKVPGVQYVPMNRYFLNRSLLCLGRAFRPQVVLYVPWTSGTPRTLLRGRILRLATSAPTALFLTQPYPAPLWDRYLTRLLLPDLALVQSESERLRFAGMGGRVMFMPSGVDTGRFRPLSLQRRQHERDRMGVRPDEKLIMHVGHLNRRRLDSSQIAELARDSKRRFVIIGSTDTPQDADLVDELRGAGVTVIRDFVPRLEETLGAADIYWFPVNDPRSSIGVPLSVLEALACGVPVVCTPFEGLPYLFRDSPCVRFFSSTLEADRAFREAPAAPNADARALTSSMDWSTVAGRVGEALFTMGGAMASTLRAGSQGP